MGTARTFTPSGGGGSAPVQAFSAYVSTHPLILGAAGVIPFDATHFNDGGAFSTTTHKFTAPAGGTYMFALTFAGSSQEGSTLNFRVNTAHIAGTWAQGAESKNLSMSAIIRLEAGDEVDVYQFYANGIYGAGAAYSNFSGFKL
jgi:hypothetical protein